MADKLISESFPAIPASDLALILDSVGLAPSDSVVDLVSLGAMASDVLVAIGGYLVDNRPQWSLLSIAPGLGQISRVPLPIQALSTRSANGLRRSGVSTWGGLACLTPNALMRLPALGRGSVLEIIALALNQAATQGLPGAESKELPTSPAADVPGEIEDLNNDSSSPLPSESWGSAQNDSARTCLPGIKVLIRWASCIEDATTIGEALDLAASHIAPSDVAEAIAALRDAPLELFLGRMPSIEAAYSLLWNQCGDERQQEIFRRRISFDAPTLDEVGEKLSLTRERVRQLQNAAQDNLSAALIHPEYAEIRWRAAQLRQELGTAISWNSVTTREALKSASRGITQDKATADDLLLWLAGPYRLDKQISWLFSEKEYLRGEVGPRSDVGPPARASLLRAISDEGVVNIEAAKVRAAAVGLVAPAIDDWIELCPFRDVDGTLVLWQGNVAEKAEALLGILKRPATADELNGLIAEGHSVRAVRDRLLSDDRFIRTDRFRVGLRHWGLEEYSGIVDEIEEEIARRGGEADVDDLVLTLTKQFDLRSSSVISYTTVPKFVVNNGRIHVRRADEPFMPKKTLFDEAHAFLLDEDRCCYRVRVDHDVLRGSGRPLPQGVGGWLGVLPGSRKQFRFRDDAVLLVSWPESALLGPALGSLRRQALARSAEAGDSLLLEFDRSSDEVEIILVRQSEIDAASGWLRGTLLTGIDAGDQTEFEQLLATAVGVSSLAELRRRCRNRGDPDLAELVRTEGSPELDDALERLKEVL